MSRSRHSAVRLVSVTASGLPIGHTEPLSAAAREYHAKRAVSRSRAGLAEVAAAAAWNPPAFTTKTEQDLDYVETLSIAHFRQLLVEARAGIV